MKNTRTLNLATLVAMLSLTILVMAGCGNDKPSPAPAEKVVNLNSLPNLFEDGQDTVIAGCDTAGFRWMDCEGAFHPGTKFVPKYGSPFTLQGEKADLRKILKLSDGEYVVIRDGRDEQARLKNLPPVVKPEPKPVPPPVKKDEATTSGWSNIPWYWLGYLFLAIMTIGALMLLIGLLRRLWQWVWAPISNDGGSGNGNQSHTGNRNDQHANTNTSTADVNTRGAVVIGRAGDMIRRTTTVTEDFVTRENRPNRRGNGGGYKGGDRREH